LPTQRRKGREREHAEASGDKPVAGRVQRYRGLMSQQSAFLITSF
jgi:hypothetical protein